MSTPIKRKLAAVPSADVAGYSRLMGDDEEDTLRLLAAHRAVVDSIINFQDGRVVNTAGDSVLAEFTSPVEAVRARSRGREGAGGRDESAGRWRVALRRGLGGRAELPRLARRPRSSARSARRRSQRRDDPGDSPAGSATATPVRRPGPRRRLHRAPRTRDPPGWQSLRPRRQGTVRRQQLHRAGRASRAALLASALARVGHRAPRRLTPLLDGAVVAGAVSLPVDVNREEGR